MPLTAAGATLLALFSISLLADEPQLKQRPPLPPNGATGYRVAQGQRIPVKFLNTVTPRGAAEGDRVYLQTVFPVSAANRIVIPTGSYIDAEVTSIRPAGRDKGRAELHVRLGQLTVPGGVPRRLHADPGSAGPSGTIAAAFIRRGPDVVLAPGTMAEIVLQDAILFSLEEIAPRAR